MKSSHTTIGMKVTVIDPSLFTIPYDTALCNALLGIGVEVRFCGRPLEDDERLDLNDQVEFLPHFYGFGTRFRRLPSAIFHGLKGMNHIASMRSLAKILQSICPNIIHFQWSVLPIIDMQLLGRLKKVAPLVLTVHDTKAFNSNPSSVLQSIGFKPLLRKFDHLIVHTNQGRERLLDLGVPARRMSIIPHGILRSPSRSAATAGPTGDHPGTVNPVRFLLFGKIKPYKGVDVLIRAVSLIPPDERASYEFVVAGRPYMDIEGLVALASELHVEGCISFVPRYLAESEVDVLFKESSVLVFPYREIEASGVLMRSLAFCKPIIASRLGAFSELLQDGRHGRLVSPGDEEGLAAAIGELGRGAERRTSISKNIEALNAAIPSWSEVARQTYEVYEALAR